MRMPDLRVERTAQEVWEFVRNEDCVAWVGSGLSIPAAYLSWQFAVEELCRRCLTGRTLPPKLDAPMMLDLADECRIAAPDIYTSTLGELFGTSRQMTRVAYNHILSCPFRGFVTTNFDPLLHFAGGNKELIVYPDPLYLTHIDRDKIVYMHGIARKNGEPDGSNLVFSRLDFDNAYNTHLLSSFMHQMLARDKILFMGCRLEEEYIRHVFQRIKILTEKFPDIKQQRRLILVAEPDDPAQVLEQEKPIQEIGIEIIRYPKLNDDHLGLDLVLERVRNRAQSKTIDRGKDLPQL